ncbi:MAG: TSUP family transporter, partial [Microbacterium sp.]|nr:TSUP family transporter [Microbacterium sp.]
MTRSPRTLRFVAACIGIGLVSGLMSGLFGVGGGTVIVPLLVLLLRFDQRLASG